MKKVVSFGALVALASVGAYYALGERPLPRLEERDIGGEERSEPSVRGTRPPAPQSAAATQGSPRAAARSIVEDGALAGEPSHPVRDMHATAPTDPDELSPEEEAAVVQKNLATMDDFFAIEQASREELENARLLDRALRANTALASANVEELRCRGRLCRVRLRALDDQSYHALAKELPGALGSQLPRMRIITTPGSDGKLEGTVYLAQAGTSLPALY